MIAAAIFSFVSCLQAFSSFSCADRRPVPLPASLAFDSLASHLVGRWRMEGDVRGKRAVYDLEAERVLGGRFIELHMIDSAAAYEARVFIGADTADGRVIAHWMDNFGAAYSVPPGYGTARGDTIQVDFAYPTGIFHDTFVYNRGDDTWEFTLLSQDARKAWQKFAHYGVKRVSRPAGD
jgi:hypothetical protein